MLTGVLHASRVHFMRMVVAFLDLTRPVSIRLKPICMADFFKNLIPIKLNHSNVDIFITESQDGGYDEEEIVEILLHRFHGNGQHSRLIHNGATTAASSSKIFGRTNELDTRPVDRMHPREPFEKKRHETNDFTQPPTDGPWHQLTCRPHTKVTAKPTLRPKRPIYRRRLPLGSRQGRKTSENLSKRGFFHKVNVT